METRESKRVDGESRQADSASGQGRLLLLNDRVGLLALLGLGLAGLVIGWHLFWFLTDDAYIAFRYVENSIHGFGYVWNPPPFRPVEGYTSFLWAALLEAVWRITGVEPPQSVNWLSLFFTALTLAISAEMAYRMARPFPTRWARLGPAGLMLLYLILNRSFLTWASSGLETALFGFLLILWVFLLNFGRRTPLRSATLSGVATLAALTRPDGLVFWAVTLAELVLEWLERERHDRFSWRAVGTLAAVCSPLAVVLLHFWWRHSFYGEWLPNTYYAKVVGAWPFSGALYAYSFLVEFCLWPILALVAVAVLQVTREWIGRRNLAPRSEGAASLLSGELLRGLPILATLTALSLHFVYFTLIVGGDHFEYRTYNHLFALAFLSLIWGMRSLGFRPRAMLVVGLLCVLLSLPVPWTHWFLTKDLNTRSQTHKMRVAVSPAWPTYLRWYTSRFDVAQRWLIFRLVCCRHQEHKVFAKFRAGELPSREQGRKMDPAGFPVFVTGSVGMAGWVMPNACIIDALALTDYVAARTPLPEGKPRRMAHDRFAPPAYLKEFRANVTFDASVLHVVERKPPLTARDIMDIETKWREWVKAKAAAVE